MGNPVAATGFVADNWISVGPVVEVVDNPIDGFELSVTAQSAQNTDILRAVAIWAAKARSAEEAGDFDVDGNPDGDVVGKR